LIEFEFGVQPEVLFNEDGSDESVKKYLEKLIQQSHLPILPSQMGGFGDFLAGTKFPYG